jgi:dolichol-phosphate mannosyltransferase
MIMSQSPQNAPALHDQTFASQDQFAAFPIIAVVIPCYRVLHKIISVIERIGPEVDLIYVVDDCCPERSGDFVERNCTDPRVRVIHHEKNQGVGGALVTGYRRALADGATVAVKIDGDGQMDPGLLWRFVLPILEGEADYTKGNRFYNPEDVRRMPPIRLLGNVGLSFMTKLSSGYWSIFDPTNGYTAIHTAVLAHMQLDKVSRRYFFESDMLFRLNTIGGKVVDVPMIAVYEDEKSSLSIKHVLFEFLGKHAKNMTKRIFYSYFLRGFSVASLELVFGLLLLAFGITTGASAWASSHAAGQVTPSGTVMLASLPIILGMQFLLAFLSYDIGSQPQNALHRRLQSYARTPRSKPPEAPVAKPTELVEVREKILDDALSG